MRERALGLLLGLLDLLRDRVYDLEGDLEGDDRLERVYEDREGLREYERPLPRLLRLALRLLERRRLYGGLRLRLRLGESERGLYESPPYLLGGGVRRRGLLVGRRLTGDGGRRVCLGEYGRRGENWRRGGDGERGGSENSTVSVAPSRSPVCMWVTAVFAACES